MSLIFTLKNHLRPQTIRSYSRSHFFSSCHYSCPGSSDSCSIPWPLLLWSFCRRQERSCFPDSPYRSLFVCCDSRTCFLPLVSTRESGSPACHLSSVLCGSDYSFSYHNSHERLSSVCIDTFDSSHIGDMKILRRIDQLPHLHIDLFLRYHPYRLLHQNGRSSSEISSAAMLVNSLEEDGALLLAAVLLCVFSCPGT